MLGLRRCVRNESGSYLPKASIEYMIRNRELGKRRRNPGQRILSASNKSATFTMTERANLANRFYPNRVNTVTVLENAAVMRCLHLASEKLVTLSHGNILSFYIRQKTGCYKLLSRHDLPSANNIITDIVESSKGEHLAYTTMDSNVYYFHIDQIHAAYRWNLFHHIHPFTVRVLKWNVVSSLCFNMDDRYLPVVEADGRISIIDLERPIRYSFQAHNGEATAVRCSKMNPNIFYTAGPDNYWKVWDSRSNTSGIPALIVATRTYVVANIDVDNEDRYIVTTSNSGTRIDAWDSRFVERAACHIYRQQSHATSHFGRGTGKKESSDFLWRARFSPQITGYRYIYANSTSGYLYLFDLVSREVQKLRKLGAKFTYCAWHPESFELTNGTVNGSIVTYYHSG